MKKLATVMTLLGVSVVAGLGADAAPAAAAARHFFQWRPFLAPFHSVVLHFPIGFLTMAGILEIYRAFRPSVELRRVTALVLWLGLLTGILSAAFGLMRAGSGEYEGRMLTLHRTYGLAVVGVTGATLWLQWLAHRHDAGRAWLRVYQASIAGTLALVMVAGHLGGNLTHGSKYLVEHAPDFLRELLEEDLADSAALDLAKLDVHRRDYVEKVQPVLERKCYNCHGPDKQKGGYRLDQPELALKGGESGKTAIKPSDPIGSHLVQLILLPPQHDDVMPPEGKEPLTLEETMTLLDWIRNGAVFPQPAELPAAAGQ